MTNRYPLHDRDEFKTARAAIFFNFAAHLRIIPSDAYDDAFDSIDSDDNALDISTTPIPRDAHAALRALACELTTSDDDFDDFMHELRHTDDACFEHDFCCDDCN